MSLADEILAISDLKAYWKLDDGSGTNVNDYGSGGHDGTAGADVKRTAAGLGNEPGKSSQFGYGSACTVSVPHHADFDISAAFSEVRCTRLWGLENGASNLNLKVNGFSGPHFQSTLVGSDVRPDLRVWGGNTVCTATSGISDIDQWHLVIRTWNGTTAKIYIDGVDVSGSTTAPSPSFTDGSEALEFGNANGRETTAHLALYGKALSATEVATLWSVFQNENSYTPLPDFRIGIHQDLNYNATVGVRQNSISRLRALHATLSRSTILWHAIEPTQGNLDWTQHDDVLAELRARGVEMHAVIAGSPTWANGGADIWQVPGTGIDASFNTWLGLYEDFVTALVTRYADDIHYWELWNEPNLLAFWNNASSAVDPAQYRAWHNTIRAAILAVDASAAVSSAGISSWSAAGGSDQAGETFFRNCMAAGTMTIDHFAYHPYVDGDPNTFLTAFDNTFYGDIRHIRDVLLEYGHDVPIWLTEFGWPSSGDSNTETTQRDWLQNALEGTRDQLRDTVERMVVFIDYDRDSATYGLHSDMPADGSAPTTKLAASMYSTFAEEFDPAGIRRLFGPTHLDTTARTLYVCPSDRRASIKMLQFSNPTGSAIDITLSIGSDAAGTRVQDDYTVAANSVKRIPVRHTLSAGEYLQAWADSVDTLVIYIAGKENET